MHNTVLIILAAVVALIVIVVLTGMRYLRADDEDDFEDDLPAERGHSRGRGDELPPARPARSAAPDDEFPAERGRSRAAADRGRPDRGRPDRGGQDRQGSGRGGPDRSWREDSGQTARDSRRGGPPDRERAGRPGGRDHADDDEPASAGGRPGRGQGPRAAGQRGPDDYDGRAGRPAAAARDYERDGRTGRDARDAGAATGPRESSAVSREERDRGATRPVSRPDARKNGSGSARRDDSLPSVRPRQGRGKRDSDGDWPSNEWDELSDVDYWAELASDKPLTTTAQPAAAARPSRGDPRPDSDSGSLRADRREAGSDREPASRSSRPPMPPVAPVPGRRGESAPGSRSEDYAGTAPRRMPGSSADSGTAMPPARTPRGGSGRPAVPADDDPLTSPSFPRVEADDSRSYRQSRGGMTASSRHPADRGPHVQPRSDPAAQTQQYSAYPALPAGQPIRGLDGSSQPHSAPAGGYPVAGGGSDYISAPADPYRSVPSGTSAPNGYPVPAAASSGGYPAPVGTSGYGAGAGYRAPGGTGSGAYPGAGSYPPVSDPGGGFRSDPATAGYPMPGPASGGYPASVPGGYQVPPADTYPAPAGSAGYAPDYGPAGPGATGSYAAPAGQGFAGQQPGVPPPAAYPAYPDAASAGHALVYPAPVAPVPGAGPAGPGVPGNGAYYPGGDYSAGSAPAAAPGYPGSHYPDGAFEPPGNPAAAPETAGYAGADPYAMDPYGYGNGGR